MPSAKSSRPAKSRSQTRPKQPSAFEKAMHDMQQHPRAFPNISARWLLTAAGIAILSALVLAWLTLCLLYWQGSWQLLYHPSAAITRNPSSAALAYDQVRFAVTETGTPQLTGWWIPADNARFTILYLHGADGNLGNTVDTLAALHRSGAAVFAIDYRGYGQSQPAKPSEQHLLADAGHGLDYLTQTRSIAAKNIVIAGSDLGANLAAEVAAAHSEIAGVILLDPLQNPLNSVLNDSRSHLVPAHWLVKDRYDLSSAAASLQSPSLWLFPLPNQGQPAQMPSAYLAAAKQKSAAWLNAPITADPHFSESLHRWLDDL